MAKSATVIPGTEHLKDEVFEAENREAQALAVAAMNVHGTSGGRFGYVSWKHEGSTGPVYVGVWSEPSDETVIQDIPFGEPCTECGYFEGMHSRSKSDEGTFYLGWMTRAQARKLAKWAGVPLTDY